MVEPVGVLHGLFDDLRVDLLHQILGQPVLDTFEAAGLSWPLPDDVTDTVLELRLFAKTGNGNRQGHRRIAEPDWASVHRELKRKHVTLSILWEEYIAGAWRIPVLALL